MEPQTQCITHCKHKKVLAYIVHLLTASGAILALFSLHFIARHDWYNAYLLLVIAVIVDSCDGLLARKLQVKVVLPEIDGGLLDNIIDFLVWALIPAFIVWEADLLAPGYNFAIVSLICLASVYQFCRGDAKSNIETSNRRAVDQDYFFRGFPSAWILLVYFMVFGHTGQVTNAIVLSTCAMFSFIPVKCIYPTRTRMWKKANIVATTIWLASLLAAFFDRNPLPLWFLALSLGYAVYYFVASARLTWLLRGKAGVLQPKQGL